MIAKAEKSELPLEPAGAGKLPAPAAASIEANTEKPITPGDAAAAKAENTEKAERSEKAENGLNSTSPAQEKEIESRKAENILLQILQQAAESLAKAGVRVAVSEGIKGGQNVVRFSVYGARICRKCQWAVIGEVCLNRECAAYGILPEVAPAAPV